MNSTALQAVLALPMVCYTVIYGVWVLMHPRRASILGLSAMTYGIQFCLGPPLAFLGLLPPLSASSNAVVLGFATVYLFWLTVLITAKFIKSPLARVLVVENGKTQPVQGLFTNMARTASTVSVSSLAWFYLVVFFVRVYAYFGYSGVLSGSSVYGSSVPYIVSATYSLLAPMGFALVFVIVVMLHQRKNILFSPVILGILSLEFLYGFTQGRRWLLMMALFVVFAAITIRGRLTMRQAVVMLLGGIFLWTFVFPFFLYSRMQWTQFPNRSPIQWATGALEAMKSDQTLEHDTYGKNVSTRLNAIVFQFMVAEKLDQGQSPMYGEVVKATAMMLVPSVIFPEKSRMVLEPDLQLNKHFGFGNLDHTSNFPEFALADFGLIGGFVYGLLFALSIRAVELMLRWLFRNTRLLGVASVSVIAAYCMFTMETTPTMFANDMLRGIALLVIVGIVFKYAFRGGQAVAPPLLYWFPKERIRPATAGIRRHALQLPNVGRV